MNTDNIHKETFEESLRKFNFEITNVKLKHLTLFQNSIIKLQKDLNLEPEDYTHFNNEHYEQRINLHNNHGSLFDVVYAQYDAYSLGNHKFNGLREGIDNKTFNNKINEILKYEQSLEIKKIVEFLKTIHSYDEDTKIDLDISLRGDFYICFEMSSHKDLFNCRVEFI